MELLKIKKKVLETYFNYDHTFANVHKLGLMTVILMSNRTITMAFGANVYNFYSNATSYYNLAFANKMDMSGISGYEVGNSSYDFFLWSFKLFI